MDEIISLVFLVIAAWYGLYRLFRALWEHDNSNESRKKGVDNRVEPWYNEYNKLLLSDSERIPYAIL